MSKPKPLPYFVAAALAVFASGAHANPVAFSDASGTLNGVAIGDPSITKSGPLRDPAAGATSGNHDVIPYVSDGAGNTGFFHVYNYGNQFGSRASGEGTFNLTGTYHQELSINSSGTFSYAIDGGELRAACAQFFSPNAGCGAGESGGASILIRITLDTDPGNPGGETVLDQFQASVGISNTAATYTPDPGNTIPLAVTTTGSVGTGFEAANWNALQRSIAVSLGAATSATLIYDMISNAVGNYGLDATSDCFSHQNVIIGAVGATGVGAGGDVGCAQGSSIARSGDPGNFDPNSSTPIVFITPGQPVGAAGSGFTPDAVPEPGTLALFGAGLAGAAWRRRRQAVKPR